MNMGGMGEAKVDGTPFNVLMQQAVKLKTHVHKIDRVRFDAWPKFYQNTAFVKDEHKKERTLAYDDRMACARAYKEKGDAAFKSGKMIEACNEYEACGGLFKWATTLREDWRTRSLEDEDIREEEFLGETDDQRRAIASLRVKCYCNLARAYAKQKEHKTAVHACDWALAVDPASAAALYLRAAFLTEPASSGTTERDAAIADLEKACEVVEAGSRTAKDVETLLRELKRLRRVGRANDKAYGGMFDRGAVYGEDESSRRRAADARAKKDEAATADDFTEPTRPGDGRCSARPAPESELAACDALIAEYERTGQHEKAAELRDGVAQARAKLERARAVQRGDAALDFSKPTAAMAADAKARGIDLDDPRVQQMLRELQEERLESQTEAGRARVRRRDAARAEAARMTTAQLLKALKDEDVPHAHCASADDLRELYVRYRGDPEATRAAAAEAAAAAAGGGANWLQLVGASLLFVLWRVWTSGLLAPAPSSNTDAARNPYLDAEPQAAFGGEDDEF